MFEDELKWSERVRIYRCEMGNDWRVMAMECFWEGGDAISGLRPHQLMGPSLADQTRRPFIHYSAGQYGGLLIISLRLSVVSGFLALS